MQFSLSSLLLPPSSLGVRAAEAHEEQEGQEVQLQPGLQARGQEHLRDLRGQGGGAALRAGQGISLNLLKLAFDNFLHRNPA